MGFFIHDPVQARIQRQVDIMGPFIYHFASSWIKVNGEAGKEFQLARSIRQRCPLTSYLFVLATNVLGYMLEDPKHGIEGLILPKRGCIWNQTFADDTALYLKGSHTNMSKT
jgi:hypothetical protein